MSGHLSRYGWALFAGVIAPLAFAPYGYYPLILFSIALLVYQWQGASARQGFISGYCFGIGYFGIGVSWLHISINLFGGVNIIGAILITALLIAFLALFPALCGYVYRRLATDKTMDLSCCLGIAAIWTLTEWTRSWVFTGFPWLSLGYSQTDSILNGMAPVLGVFGITLVLVFSAACVVAIAARPSANRYLALSLLVLWGISWLLAVQDWTQAEDKQLGVAMIQGAIPQAVKWSPEMRQPTLDLYRELSKPHLDQDLIIWPEAAIPAFYHQVPDYIEQLRQMSEDNNLQLLTGIPYHDDSSGSMYNSVAFLGENTDHYFKKHLVPFGEYLPLKPLLGGLIEWLGVPMADFSSGPDRSPVLDAGEYKLGISICYEDIFGNEVIQAMPDAALLVNISNDAWFGDSAAPHQHMQIARMRAIETGRYMVRVTNTGISALIDEKGRLIAQLPQFTGATYAGDVVLFSGHTPYSRVGNYPVVLLSLGLLLILIYRRKSRD